MNMTTDLTISSIRVQPVVVPLDPPIQTSAQLLESSLLVLIDLCTREGLFWIEEPVRADDFHGYAAVAREARTAIQTGESWWGPSDAAKCLAVGGCDHAMLRFHFQFVHPRHPRLLAQSRLIHGDP